MTLAELITEVYTVTNRPDLVAETTSALRSALLKAHRWEGNYFPKDLFETGISFPTPAYFQSIDYRTIIPRWRALKYLRKYDTNSYPPPGEAGKFFEVIVPEGRSSLDSYDINKEDVCYLAGEVIQVRSCTEIQYALLGCYINPAAGATDDTYGSWLSTEYPWALIHLASATVLGAIGKLDEAQRQTTLAGAELQILINSNVVAVGD